MYVMRLFVSIENHLVDLLKQTIEKEISAGKIELFEIVNVLKNPEIALTHQVLMTPTLLRLSPKPSKRIVGDMSRFQDIAKEIAL